MNRKGLLRETSKIFLNGLFYRNPVLIGALGLYPVVAVGYSLKNAAELSVLFFLIALPTSLFTCLIGGFAPARFRSLLALLTSALFYLPAAWLTERLTPGSVSSLGMVGSLTICNSIILSRASEYAPTHIGWAVAADALGGSLGFSAVILLTSAIRELWHTGAYGTFDRGISLPFSGFVLLGFFAALVQWVNQKRARKAEKKRVTQI